MKEAVRVPTRIPLKRNNLFLGRLVEPGVFYWSDSVE
jgi:hypothetical protein